MFSGAAPKPSVTVLKETNDWSLLQCVVQGASPEPEVEWKDSDGKVVPAEKPQVTRRGQYFDVTLNATVNRSDYYHCVATQAGIHHQTKSTIHVHFNGEISFFSIYINIF